MTATIVITIIVSVLTSFLAPLIFAGAASTFSFIFEHFTNPFRFTYVDNDGNGITNWFVDMVGADLLNIIVKIMISAGVVLAVFILAVNLFKLFASGISRRIDSPISLCIRAVMAIFLSYWIIDIVYEVAFPIFQWLLDKVNNITISSGETVMSAINSFYSITKSTPSSSFGLDANTSYMTDWKSAIEGLTSNATYDVLGGVLTTIIFIIFFFKSIISMFKLIAEMAERYLLVNVLTICSPMIMPTIISNGTIQVFVSWVQMMLANCLVLVFNSLGMIMLKMAFINVGIHCSAYGNNGISWTSAITSMIVYVALIKVVQKFDVYLAQLAFKIQAIGGDNKGMTVGGLLALGAKAQKNAADISKAGGFKNAVGEKVGNFVGVFSGNRDGLAGKLSKGAQDYKAVSGARDKEFGSVEFGKSSEGMDLEGRKLDTELAKAQNDALQDKKTEIETQKAINNAAAMENANYIEAKTQEEAAKLNLNSEMYGDGDYVDAKIANDVEKTVFEGKEVLSPGYTEARKEKTLADEFSKGQIFDDSAVKSAKIENEARTSDIRSRALGTDVGKEAKIREIETMDVIHEETQKRRSEKHAAESEKNFFNDDNDSNETE